MVAKHQHSDVSWVALWLSASLGLALIYGLRGLKLLLSNSYSIQDDARQHVFWMQRFVDPALYPQDPIADYFQTVAPWGYSTLYWLMAQMGIEPQLTNKLLPIALGLISTVYCFRVCHKITGIPFSGFLGSSFLNQVLWINDDLISATPRAFAYPLILAFIDCNLRRSPIFCLIVIALAGLFYPTCVLLFITVLTLQLFELKKGWLHPTSQLRTYGLWLLALVTAAGVLLPFGLKIASFGPVITAAEAKSLPEFWPGGRSYFFDDNFWSFWFIGRSGLTPELILPLMLLNIILILIMLLLPPRALPSIAIINPKLSSLTQLILTSIILFFVAHAFLFKLHLPSRYTTYSLSIVLVLTATIILSINLDRFLILIRQRSRSHEGQIPLIRLGLFLAGFILISCPFWLELDNSQILSLVHSEHAALYTWLGQSPEDTLIASLSPEADNLPIFAHRSVLVSREHSIPYHTRYYLPLRQRAADLLQAQYSPHLDVVQGFVEKYGVDLWLLDEDAFASGYFEDKHNRWLKQFQPEAAIAIAQLRQGITPALAQILENCSVFKTQGLQVLDASCIVAADPHHLSSTKNLPRTPDPALSQGEPRRP